MKILGNKIKCAFRKYIITSLPLWGGMGWGVLTSCESDYEWEPGPEVPAGTPAVYFSSDNLTVIGHPNDESTKFVLMMGRKSTDGDLTVPIVVVDSMGCMTVPKSVTFADGEDQADLVVGYKYTPGMYLSLRLGDGYGNTYLEQEGTLAYKCHIAKLQPFCKVKYRDGSNLEAVESYIYGYEGINQFLFTNFMDSHINVNFKVNTDRSGVKFDPENPRTLKGDFIPIDNRYAYGGGWLLCDYTTGEWPQWTPTGWDKTVHYFYYYDYSEEYERSYSYIDFSNKSYSYFMVSSFYFDEDWTDSFTPPYLYYSFDYNSLPQEANDSQETTE